jgi:hypothetical protein
VWDRGAVAAFDASDSDEVLVLECAPVPGAAEAVRGARVGEWRSTVTADRAAELARTGLAELRVWCAPLAAEVAALAGAFLAQFGLPAAHLRLEVLDTVSCPKFHCDNLRVRLVAACVGSGTEYVCADRPDDVFRAPPGALVFLKGHKHPTYADRVLHRSPPAAPGARRFCVVLDT